MMQAQSGPPAAGFNHRHDKVLFWGCFIALVTTAFGFIGRIFLVGTWAQEFELDGPQSGRLLGIGIWPFAASIIGFSLIIDRIGYKVAMLIAFAGHILWAVMGVSAYYVSKGGNRELAFQLVYWGSLVLALGNGTVESFINPVVATMFSKEKTKWLNILHAGWPGGLVLAGMITIYIDTMPWGIKVGVIAAPALIYLLMLLPCKFPVQERVASGVSYREMLSEFGILGAAIVGFLVTLQLMDFVSVGGEILLTGAQKGIFCAIGIAIVVGFGMYTRALGRFLMFFLILIMMPLATTEIGTDAWITDIMTAVVAGTFHPGWVLVYTSLIMVVLRFFAGPIVHALSPLGLLAVSAILAIAGLYVLSFSVGFGMIFIAATLYGFGKTFFWPTMLGVVSEQMPKGGALTLNAISGIGMLAVGTLGTPYIGKLVADKQNQDLAATIEVAQQVPGLVEGGKLTVLEDKSIYEVIQYQRISAPKLEAVISKLPESQRQPARDSIQGRLALSKQGALVNMTIFPTIMLAGYVLLILYFKARGGYRAQVLGEGGH